MSEWSRKEYNEDNPWRNEGTLRELYWSEEFTLPEIADKFDITHQAVQYWFDKFGIQTRKQGGYSDGKYMSVGIWNKTELGINSKQAIFCANCNTLVPTQDNQLCQRRFCSTECYHEMKPKRPNSRVYLTCDHCGAEFYTVENQIGTRRFCSHKCYSKFIDEGKGTLNDIFRAREAAAGWKVAVIERDDYTCQDCGQRGGDLHISPR